MKRCLIFLLLIGSTAGQTTPTQLGIHTDHMNSWPIEVPFDVWRSISSTSSTGSSQWRGIQTAPAIYNFGLIDQAMTAIATTGNVKAMYTPNGTPDFIANTHGYQWDYTKGTRTCVCNSSQLPNGCNPPTDMNADGSGTNQTWKDFITALATHVHTNHIANPTGYADIEYWENGNEWITNGQQFCGSYAQEARMMWDESNIVKAINPSAKMMTVALAGGVSGDIAYLNTKPNVTGAQSPAQLADIVDYHCYIFATSQPETIVKFLKFVIKETNSVPDAAGKPVSCSEGGWGAPRGTNGFSSWTQATNWLDRYLLALSSTGIVNFNVYMYDNFLDNFNGLPSFNPDLWAKDNTYGCLNPTVDGNGFLCDTGVDWTMIHQWTRNLTFNNPCQSQPSGAGNIWTCDHHSTGGVYVNGQFVWFDVLDGEANYTIPTGFSAMSDIKGKVKTLASGQAITLTNSPVLLMQTGLPQPPTLLHVTMSD
jgi:hypothetical protein